jgi:hypothetical protein
VLEALERTVKNGCALKVLLERDPWSTWWDMGIGQATQDLYFGE